MSDYVDQFYELCDQAGGTASLAKVQLFEEAVRLADTHQDMELGVEGRLALIECSTFSGCTDRAIPAMGWLLAKTDADPDLLAHADEYTLMWSYKWIAGNLAYFPDISMRKMQAMIEDMARRYGDLGYDQHAVEAVLVNTDLALGKSQGLRKSFARWKKEPRGEMSDCHACEVNTEMKCHLFWDELDEALRVAQPLFNRRLSCEEVPFASYNRILLPLFDADKLELADTYQRRAQRQISRVPGERGTVGHHLEFLALTDQANRACRILDNNLASAMTITDLDQRFDFFTSAAVMLRVLKDQGRETIKLRRHHGVGVACDKDRRFPVDELERFFDDLSRQIAQRFDDRAGTAYWESKRKIAFARIGQYKPYARPTKDD